MKNEDVVQAAQLQAEQDLQTTLGFRFARNEQFDTIAQEISDARNEIAAILAELKRAQVKQAESTKAIRMLERRTTNN